MTFRTLTPRFRFVIARSLFFAFSRALGWARMNSPSFPLPYAKPRNLKFFVAFTLAIWLLPGSPSVSASLPDSGCCFPAAFPPLSDFCTVIRCRPHTESPARRAFRIPSQIRSGTHSPIKVTAGHPQCHLVNPPTSYAGRRIA